jgi:hypothetical protein
MFADEKSKYGSVEPPNVTRVVKLILCDVSKLALLSHIPRKSATRNNVPVRHQVKFSRHLPNEAGRVTKRLIIKPLLQRNSGE